MPLLGGGFVVLSETAFKPLPLGVCDGFASAIDFLCGFAWCVALQFQAKQLLNLCRFVGLLVWNFNLHLKQRDRFFIFEPLPVWSVIDFPLRVCLFGALIYIKNKTE
ncbi:MAG: hypothetical protein LBC75_01935 [Fibromonadaceae bacterium]|nr:hypothetical protein [Fibromonadaceae bacterium]